MMDEVARHYGDGQLLDRILDAVTAAGIDPQELTVHDLASVDEFHIGGRRATRHLVEGAGLGSSRRVLDVGSGVGGTARYLAAAGGHDVVGVDLTVEYVETAAALSRLVGLEGSVEFQVADVMALPFERGEFDAAVQLHVGMNIADKQAAFAEVGRVLVEGGVFALYDIMGRADTDLEFPLPWAGGAAGSHLATADQYVGALEAAGFRVERVTDRRDFARSFFGELRERSGPPPSLGLHLLMGEEAPTRYGNMVKAVEAGAVAPVEIVARRG